MSPVFQAVVATVVPEAAKLDEAGWREVEGLVESTIRGRPPALRRRLRLFLRFVHWSPLLRWGRPFTSLDPGRRTRLLAGLQSSRIAALRLGVWGLRTLALLGYYGRTAAAEAIGYRPHPRGWEGVR